MQILTRSAIASIIASFFMLIATQDKNYMLLVFPTILVYSMAFEYIETIINYFQAPKKD